MPQAVEVLPNFTLDNSLYEAAAQGLADHTTLQPLVWDDFTLATNWWLIPDTDGELSKAELTLINTPRITVRMNIWYRSDLRGDGRPMPHNHPWNTFTSHILRGGYDEDRYRRTPSGLHIDKDVTHASPGANTVDHDLFHEVSRIHDPGKTLTLMICKDGQRGDWCHLDVDTGADIHDQPVTDFSAMLTRLNPQH